MAGERERPNNTHTKPSPFPPITHTTLFTVSILSLLLAAGSRG